MFFNPWWPIIVLNFAERTRQSYRNGLYFSACFNPALALWLKLYDPEYPAPDASDKPGTPATDKPTPAKPVTA